MNESVTYDHSLQDDMNSLKIGETCYNRKHEYQLIRLEHGWIYTKHDDHKGVSPSSCFIPCETVSSPFKPFKPYITLIKRFGL